MRIAQIAGAFAVLVDDAHGGLDHVLGHGRFTGGNLFLRRHRAAVLPGEPRAGDGPAQQADNQQPAAFAQQSPSRSQKRASREAF
jgi:hypothetical protein